MRLPAMANVHSHAFQRDLRGIGERSESASWVISISILPPSESAAKRAAGYGAVGEFHYIHDAPGFEPNAMAYQLAVAAESVGLRIVLLPAAYARGGHPRFRDPSVDAYLARVDALRSEGYAVGVAAHSVRAVPDDWLREILPGPSR